MKTDINKALELKSKLIDALHTLYDATIYLPKKDVMNPFASAFGYNLPMELTNQPGMFMIGGFMSTVPGRFILINCVGPANDWEKNKELFYPANTRLLDAESHATYSIVGLTPKYEVVPEYPFREHRMTIDPYGLGRHTRA